MKEETFDFRVELKGVTPREYYLQPIPSELDNKIWCLINSFVSSGGFQNKNKYILNPETRWLLITYGVRAATRGVRQYSKEILLSGLVALIIENFDTDFRESQQTLCLLYNAALKIKFLPDELIKKAALLATQKVIEEFYRFLKRPSEEKTIESMGFIEILDSTGFRYERGW